MPHAATRIKSAFLYICAEAGLSIATYKRGRVLGPRLEVFSSSGDKMLRPHYFIMLDTTRRLTTRDNRIDTRLVRLPHYCFCSRIVKASSMTVSSLDF